MRNLHYVLFPLFVCVLANCGKSPSSKTPPPKSPEQVELTIKIQDLEFNIPIELNDSSKGSRSFSENEAVGRNLATNVSYNYVGTIDLEDSYSPDNPIKGHLIAFLISQFDPNSKKTTFSEVHYGIYTGKSTSVFNSRGVQIALKPLAEGKEQ